MSVVEPEDRFCQMCKNNLNDPKETEKILLPTKTEKHELDVYVCPVCDLGEEILRQLTNDSK